MSRHSVKIRFFLFTVLFMVILSGCLSVKPASQKSGKKFFESFYLGAEGSQYFIKPLLLKDDQANEFWIDFTFRYKDEIKDSTTMNFSIHSSEVFKTVDSVVISSPKVKFTASQIELLFNSNPGKYFISRFTTSFEMQDLYHLFESDKWVFEVYHTDQVFTFIPVKKTSKTIGVLREKIFILM